MSESNLAAFEDGVCPACGERRLLRVVGHVGTAGRGFAIGIEPRVACACPPPQRAIAAPSAPKSAPKADSGA